MNKKTNSFWLPLKSNKEDFETIEILAPIQWVSGGGIDNATALYEEFGFNPQ